LQTQRVLESLNIPKNNQSRNYFYSTWDETILKSFVEKITKEIKNNTDNVSLNDHYKHLKI
jgi:hypothetical protein